MFDLCLGDRQLYAEVSWEKPLNLDYIRYKSIVYEVVAQADLFGITGEIISIEAEV
jgi:hypothetical protein